MRISHPKGGRQQGNTMLVADAGHGVSSRSSNHPTDNLESGVETILNVKEVAKVPVAHVSFHPSKHRLFIRI